MNISFEGVGQWGATFACADVEVGNVVQMKDNGTVGPCASGDTFAGVATHVGRDGAACTVALGGAVTCAYSGTAPTAGWNKLSADGNGGVSVNSAGHDYLVLDVDEAAGKVAFVL